MFSIFLKTYNTFCNNRAKWAFLLRNITGNRCWAGERKNKTPLKIGLVD